MDCRLDRGRNALLGALPDAEWERLAPAFDVLRLERGSTLREPDGARGHVYFPVSGIVSLVCTLASGATAEVAVAGHEGVVGALEHFAAASSSSWFVQAPGFALRINAHCLRQHGDAGGALAGLVRSCAGTLVGQLAQMAVCNRYHGVDQQLCRWLLMRLDRLPSTRVVATHELIARLLGVRRETVTEAMGSLQAAGLIRSSRGSVEVANPARLAQLSCECHGAMARQYARMLPGVGSDDARRLSVEPA